MIAFICLDSEAAAAPAVKTGEVFSGKPSKTQWHHIMSVCCFFFVNLTFSCRGLEYSACNWRLVRCSHCSSIWLGWRCLWLVLNQPMSQNKIIVSTIDFIISFYSFLARLYSLNVFIFLLFFLNKIIFNIIIIFEQNEVWIDCRELWKHFYIPQQNSLAFFVTLQYEVNVSSQQLTALGRLLWIIVKLV